MNYIAILNKFYDFIQQNEVSSKAQHLYSTLLFINNKTDWSDWFSRTNISLCGIMGISEKALVSARKELQEFGLIDFTTSKKRGETTQYHIIDTSENNQKSINKSTKKDQNKSTKEDQKESIKASKPTYKKTEKVGNSNNRFNQFPQREYTIKDLDDIERNLLSKNSLSKSKKEDTNMVEKDGVIESKNDAIGNHTVNTKKLLTIDEYIDELAGSE